MTEQTAGSRPVAHPQIDLTAPVEYWRALAEISHRYRVQHVPDAHSDEHPGEQWELYIDPINDRNLDGVLLQGIDHTGAHDERAIAWALDEIQRRAEERSRTEAALREADAVAELAKALRSEADQAFLERLLPRLTERTRYAVRAQLRESGGI